MYSISKIYRKFRDIISEFLYLKVVSLGTTGFLISISILVMIFDAMSIISIMPLIDFIRLDQDIEIYVSETKYAEKLGADGALIVTPYYNKPTQDGLYLHYKKIAESTDLPIIIYIIIFLISLLIYFPYL